MFIGSLTPEMGIPFILGKAKETEFLHMQWAKQMSKQEQIRETDFQHKVLVLKIPHSADKADSIYEAVRKSWRLGEKAKEAKYVLAVLKGCVIGVFVAQEWEEYPSDDGSPSRWGFVGEEAPDAIKKLYMRTRIPASMRKKGAANPVRYSY